MIAHTAAAAAAAAGDLSLASIIYITHGIASIFPFAEYAA